MLKFIKVGNYTNEDFNDEKFYLNLTDKKIDLILKFTNRFYNSDNELNKKFLELGFRSEENASERMRNYLLSRKEMVEIKEFAKTLIKEDEVVGNKKRL